MSSIGIGSYNIQPGGPDIDPVINTGPIPLSQVGINFDNTYEVKYRPPTENDLEVANNCRALSGPIFCLVIIVIVAIIFMVYMYAKNPDGTTLFSFQNDPEDRGLNIVFIIGVILWGIVGSYISFTIESTTKVYGRYRSISPAINQIQNDIYILLANIILLLLAISSIVFYKNLFFMILFAVLAVIVLFAWKPKGSYGLLVVAEGLILFAYGKKFAN